MRKVELHLIGKCRLFVDGTEASIEPRSLLECLAQIVVAGPRGISRVELAERLWDHLDGARARAQLRGALHRLRAWTTHLGIAAHFDFDSQVVRLLGPVQTDVDLLLQSRLRNAAEVREFLQPFAEGWSRAHWYPQADAVSEVFADLLVPICARGREGAKKELLLVLRDAVRIYPTNVRLNMLLVSHLAQRRALVEANEAIIVFEDNWVGRFGAGDIPKIIIGGGVDAHHSRSSRRRVGQVILASVLVATVYIVTRPAQTATDASLHAFRIQALSQRDFLRTWRLPIGPETEVTQLSSAEYHFQSKLPNGEYVQHVWRNRTEVEELDPDGFLLADELGSLKLWHGDADPSFVKVSGSGKPFVIHGNPTYPNVIAQRFLMNGDILYERCCTHPILDHRRAYIRARGNDWPIDLAYQDVQVSVVTAVLGNMVYGKCSSGRVGGWRYNSFKYDATTGISSRIKHAPVISVSSTGELLTLPEVTDVKGGDYNTHWDNTIEIVSITGQTRRLKVGSLDKFYAVHVLGDTLILASRDHPNPGYIAVDFNGRVDRRFDQLLGNTKRVISHRGGTGHGKFVVLESYVPGRASTFDLVLVEAN